MAMASSTARTTVRPIRTRVRGISTRMESGMSVTWTSMATGWTTRPTTVRSTSCDNCPVDFNPDQADADDDGIGDVCDLDCEFRVTLDRTKVSSEDTLAFTVYLKHNRADTVTVPFAFWIEDASGEIFVHKVTAPRTFYFGDELKKHFVFPVPDILAPGEYELNVGIEEMEQGRAWAKQRFTVVGPSSQGQ